jgi:hypothetical protein
LIKSRCSDFQCFVRFTLHIYCSFHIFLRPTEFCLFRNGSDRKNLLAVLFSFLSPVVAGKKLIEQIDHIFKAVRNVNYWAFTSKWCSIHLFALWLIERPKAKGLNRVLSTMQTWTNTCLVKLQFGFLQNALGKSLAQQPTLFGDSLSCNLRAQMRVDAPNYSPAQYGLGRWRKSCHVIDKFSVWLNTGCYGYGC